jgi:hypothetical protein
MDMKKILMMFVATMLVINSVYAIAFVIEPNSVNMTVLEKGKTKSTIQVRSPNGFEKMVKIEENPEWLGCDPTEFKISGGNSQTINLNVDSASLKPGLYNSVLILKNITPGDRGEKVNVPVSLTVVSEKDQISAVPRSIDIMPGVSRVIFIKNPSDFPLNATISSSNFWIQVYPNRIDIPANGSNLIWVKMIPVGLGGGIYPSSLSVETELSTLTIPVKGIVSSGIEFNPETVLGSGPLTLTNKLKRSVLVQPMETENVTYSVKSVDIPAGASKIINVKFIGETKPEYLSFTIINGTNLVHNIKVAK